MAISHKVLLVDDDPDLLDMYRELLADMPSRPEVFTANSGTRAMAMLEAEPFRLLICDLRMPKVDGLQVLSIVRRKYPQLRTVALTSVVDEQFRSRVYALGVDLFWHKPGTQQETQMFLACLESLLGQENESGFRGLQSKSLVDIIQLECISQSSSVLRITNAALSGKIWIQDGELIDAETEELRGEAAFQKVLSWRTGSFETLPAEPTNPTTACFSKRLKPSTNSVGVVWRLMALRLPVLLRSPRFRKLTASNSCCCSKVVQPNNPKRAGWRVRNASRFGLTKTSNAFMPWATACKQGCSNKLKDLGSNGMWLWPNTVRTSSASAGSSLSGAVRSANK